MYKMIGMSSLSIIAACIAIIIQSVIIKIPESTISVIKNLSFHRKKIRSKMLMRMNNVRHIASNP